MRSWLLVDHSHPHLTFFASLPKYPSSGMARPFLKVAYADDFPEPQSSISRVRGKAKDGVVKSFKLYFLLLGSYYDIGGAEQEKR